VQTLGSFSEVERFGDSEEMAKLAQFHDDLFDIYHDLMEEKK